MSERKIEAFTMSGSAKDGAEIDLIYLDGPSLHRSGDFNLALTGYGFEAERYLTREELSDLRDWITCALAAS